MLAPMNRKSANTATSQRLRRALRPHRPRRVSRLAPDHRPPPPRARTPLLHDPLQPPAPAPRTRVAQTRTDRRHWSADGQEGRTPETDLAVIHEYDRSAA